MRPAEFSTENPPNPIDDLETKEYINGLRRRIEVQNDLLEALAAQAQHFKKENDSLRDEIDKLSLDLAIKEEKVGSGWQKGSP